MSCRCWCEMAQRWAPLLGSAHRACCVGVSFPRSWASRSPVAARTSLTCPTHRHRRLPYKLCAVRRGRLRQGILELPDGP